jgi:hypothetical protein
MGAARNCDAWGVCNSSRGRNQYWLFSDGNRGARGREFFGRHGIDADGQEVTAPQLAPRGARGQQLNGTLGCRFHIGLW